MTIISAKMDENESELKELAIKKITTKANFFPVFLFLAFLLINLSVVVMTIGRQKNLITKAFLDAQGLLTPPANVEILTAVDQINQEIDLKAGWSDVTLGELGYVIYWYIDDITTGTVKKETPDITSADFYSIKCKDNAQDYYVYILLSAYSQDDVSMPVTSAKTITVPSCSEIGEVGSANPYADINKDKRVDILDYSILFENYGLNVTQNFMCELVE